MVLHRPVELAALIRQMPNGLRTRHLAVECHVVMGKAKIILGLAVIALAVIAIAGWQIGSCELANLELQGDLRDVAAQVGTRIGLDAESTEEELRNVVVRKAQQHDIQLDPGQVTVIRTGTGESSVVYLAADYKVRVNLLGYSFALHFTPSSKR